MVFFSSILIVAILYYLQARGLIFVAIIAVAGEMINIFMAKTMTKEAEKKTVVRFAKVVQGYKAKIDAQKKTIKELEDIQEDSVRKVYAANKKVKEYEAKLGISEDAAESEKEQPGAVTGKAAEDKPAKNKQKPFENNDLPDGSNRKKLPV